MTDKKEEKKFNETVTMFFEDKRFGEKSFVSKPLSTEDIEKLKSGVRLLFKNSCKTTAKGEEYAFLEILPPRKYGGPGSSEV